MSFMYNPFPFDDPKPVNRPELSKKTIDAVVSGGTPAVAKKFAASVIESARESNRILAFDGYTTVDWKLFLNLVARECRIAGVEFVSIDQNKECFKSGEEIDNMIDPLLIWDTKIDPTLLYGKIYKGGYEGLLDEVKTKKFEENVMSLKEGKGKVVAVYGYGCLIPRFRKLYDVKCFFDITPKTSILRIRGGEYSNIGKERPDQINRVIRRCYYCDFEIAVCNRRELLHNSAIDFFFLADDPKNIVMMPFETFSDICAQLVKYPFRAKPCYLEGVCRVPHVVRQVTVFLHEETPSPAGQHEERGLGVRLHTDGGQRAGEGRRRDSGHQLLHIRLQGRREPHEQGLRGEVPRLFPDSFQLR